MNQVETESNTFKMTWSRLIAVVLAIFCVRAAYLIWWCPYELAADEAQYWDWSRRLDWSYYSKGPAVAWLIALSVKLFGITEWAVRLPAALSAAVSMVLIARFARSASAGNSRAGWYALGLFALLPVYYGTSQFMTTDGPYYVFWLAAAYTGWIMTLNNRTSPAWFFFLGALIGLGMLCKYTALLILPGLLVFLFRRAPLTAFQRLAGSVALLAGITLFALPIAIWNHQHDWPTIRHLFGAMQLPGGDVTPTESWEYSPTWTLGYLFYVVVLLGPPATLLLNATIRAAFRITSPVPPAMTPRLSDITGYALHLGLPVFVFYLFVSFKTDVKLNWPSATFLVCLVPMACYLAGPTITEPVRRLFWRWILGLGLATVLLISFAPTPLRALGKIKINGEPINTARALSRISGFPPFARSVEKAAGEMERETRQKPFFIASTYGRAALLAFYMNEHPVVYCAGSYRGARESSYDYFTDTDLADPKLLGRPVILLDHDQWSWEQALYFQSIERTRFYGRVYRGYEYRGPSREPHMK
jgi:undecaprenyl-diphosphatase